jgi:hypothetical protein
MTKTMAAFPVTWIFLIIQWTVDSFGDIYAGNKSEHRLYRADIVIATMEEYKSFGSC